MSVDALFANTVFRRFVLAAAVSVAVHFVAAMMIETSMNRSGIQKPVLPSNIEISRRPVEGSRTREEIDKMLDPTDPSNPLSNVQAGVPVKRQSPPPGQNDPGAQAGGTNPRASRQPDLPPFSNVGVPIPQNPRQRTDPQNDSPQTQNQAPNNSNPPRQDPGRDNNNMPPERGRQNDSGSGINQPGQDSGTPGGSVPTRRSRGPNRAAAVLSAVEPRVPSSLMGPGVTNSVGVKVAIKADGSASVSIERSSGSAEVDDILLRAMRQWKWDPAAEDNVPVDSTQTFKYIFKTG